MKSKARSRRKVVKEEGVMTIREKLVELRRRVGGVIKRDQDVLAAFSVKVVEQPSHAFRWAIGEFSAAAELEVYQQIERTLSALDDATAEESLGDLLEGLRETALRNVVQRAMSPASSSNPCSNIYETESLAAWTGFYKDFLGVMDGKFV